jgi:hypothetical protein
MYKKGDPRMVEGLIPPGTSKAFRECFKLAVRVIKAGARWRPSNGIGKM